MKIETTDINEFRKMKTNALKTFILSVALSMSATGFIYASDPGSKEDKDKCESTSDLKITNARIDIDDDGQSEIQGKILNTSDDVDYRNVRIRLNFIDEDGDQIGSQIATVERVISDGNAEDFSLQFTAPKETESATYSVECAEKE